MLEGMLVHILCEGDLVLTSNIIEKGSDFDETILVAKVSVEKMVSAGEIE